MTGAFVDTPIVSTAGGNIPAVAEMTGLLVDIWPDRRTAALMVVVIASRGGTIVPPMNSTGVNEIDAAIVGRVVGVRAVMLTTGDT